MALSEAFNRFISFQAKEAKKADPKVFLRGLLEEKLFFRPVQGVLYGSRSFADTWYSLPVDFPITDMIIEESDWDIAVEEDPFLLNVLYLRGWEEKEELAYQDRFTKSVWGGEIDGEKIQVSFKTNLAQFRTAWESIDPTFYWTFLNKRSPRYIGAEAVCKFMDILEIASAESKRAQNIVESVYATPVQDVYRWEPEAVGFHQIDQPFGEIIQRDPD